NIRHLGAGGTRIVNHGFQHLCRRDDRLARQVAEADDTFLDDPHLVHWNLFPGIAPLYNDSFNALEVLPRTGYHLHLLDLSDHRAMGTNHMHDLSDRCDILRPPNVGRGNPVDTPRKTKSKVVDILRRHRWNVE